MVSARKVLIRQLTREETASGIKAFHTIQVMKLTYKLKRSASGSSSSNTCCSVGKSKRGPSEGPAAELEIEADLAQEAFPGSLSVGGDFNLLIFSHKLRTGKAEPGGRH